MTDTTFETLGLSSPILRALHAENYHTPTPVQERAIPLLMSGGDLLAMAQTGTGKTAAYCLPMLEKLAADVKPPLPRTAKALILVPTRELALQVHESLLSYGKHLKLRHAVIMGGVNMRPQTAALTKGVHVIIATTGRLLDHMREGHIDLSQVSTLVLDEADRMLDMGFINDVRHIVKLLPKSRQSALFSATMPPEVAKLAAQILQNPERLEIARTGTTAALVTQNVIFTDRASKMRVLQELLSNPAFSRTIIFTRTKRGADRVAAQIGKFGVTSEAFHGNKSQNARQRALERFSAGKVRVLVATDIAARGIDIDDVSHVINFELPDEAESYIHRIGRTARAGTEGIALSLCDPGERGSLRGIEKLTGRKLVELDFKLPPGAPRDLKGEIEAIVEPYVDPRREDRKPRRKPAFERVQTTGSFDPMRSDRAHDGDDRNRGQTRAKRTLSPANRMASNERNPENPRVASNENEPKGTVKWFNAEKGFGFVEPEDGGKDVFLHISVAERAGIGTPREGQKVRYEVETDQRGRLSATSLKAA